MNTKGLRLKWKGPPIGGPSFRLPRTQLQNRNDERGDRDCQREVFVQSDGHIRLLSRLDRCALLGSGPNSFSLGLISLLLGLGHIERYRLHALNKR